MWKWAFKLLSHVQQFVTHGLYSPWNSLGQNTGVGSCSLLQGIFPNQVSHIAGRFIASWAPRETQNLSKNILTQKGTVLKHFLNPHVLTFHEEKRSKVLMKFKLEESMKIFFKYKIKWILVYETSWRQLLFHFIDLISLYLFISVSFLLSPTFNEEWMCISHNSGESLQ